MRSSMLSVIKAMANLHNQCADAPIDVPLVRMDGEYFSDQGPRRRGPGVVGKVDNIKPDHNNTGPAPGAV